MPAGAADASSHRRRPGRAPIAADEPLITRAMLSRMLLMVVASVAATFGWFTWRLASGAPFVEVQSETFTLLAVCQWFNALNCRSELKSALTFDLVRNPWLLGGLVLANLLQFAVIYTAPMNRIFHTVPISLPNIFLIGAAASLMLWVEEVRKIFARRRARASASP